jgi:hypothetical protein
VLSPSRSSNFYYISISSNVSGLKISGARLISGFWAVEALENLAYRASDDSTNLTSAFLI